MVATVTFTFDNSNRSNPTRLPQDLADAGASAAQLLQQLGDITAELNSPAARKFADEIQRTADLYVALAAKREELETPARTDSDRQQTNPPTGTQVEESAHQRELAETALLERVSRIRQALFDGDKSRMEQLFRFEADLRRVRLAAFQERLTNEWTLAQQEQFAAEQRQRRTRAEIPRKRPPQPQTKTPSHKSSKRDFQILDGNAGIANKQQNPGPLSPPLPKGVFPVANNPGGLDPLPSAFARQQLQNLRNRIPPRQILAEIAAARARQQLAAQGLDESNPLYGPALGLGTQAEQKQVSQDYQSAQRGKRSLDLDRLREDRARMQERQQQERVDAGEFATTPEFARSLRNRQRQEQTDFRRNLRRGDYDSRITPEEQGNAQSQILQQAVDNQFRLGNISQQGAQNVSNLIGALQNDRARIEQLEQTVWQQSRTIQALLQNAARN